MIMRGGIPETNKVILCEKIVQIMGRIDMTIMLQESSIKIIPSVLVRAVSGPRSLGNAFH